MSRVLNPELFGDFKPKSIGSDSSSAGTSSKIGEKAEVCQEDLQILVAQLDQLKRKVKELDGNYEKSQINFTEFVESSRTRFERFNKAGSRMESYLKSVLEEINNKFAQLGSRVSEKKIQDSKLEEMLSRHNLILQGYESRISQLQKVINEQNIQLMGMKSALDEARKELAKRR